MCELQYATGTQPAASGWKIKRKGPENANEYVGSVQNVETGFKSSFLSCAETKPLLFNFSVLMLLYLAVGYGVP